MSGGCRIQYVARENRRASCQASRNAASPHYEDGRLWGVLQILLHYRDHGCHRLRFHAAPSRPVAALALLPVIAFGVADAQYLRVERRFRGVFNLVRAESWEAMPSFDINLESAPKHSFLSAITSWSIVWFYAPLAVGVLLSVLGAWAYG
jgi:hypothetical protein